MIAKKLNDAQMRDFILNGYVTVKTDHPRDFHEAIFKQTETVFEKEGNPGNNLLPRIPAVQEILVDPAVHGALISVLGPNYYMHPHRHCHYNPPGSKGQNIHKDSWTRRRHPTRWVMALYYPQNTPEERGPTGIVPGSQYYNTRAGEDGSREIPLSGEAGTVVIVHYDLWHRAMPNRSDEKRYMMKFLFTRLEEPQSPSWDSEQEAWEPIGHPKDETMWTYLWDWHYGKGNGKRSGTDASIPKLIEALEDKSESVCFDAAYTLGAIGKPAVSALVNTLKHPSDIVRRNASYALSAIGAPAVPELIEALSHSNGVNHADVADTLGDIGPSAQEAIPVLAEALADESVHLRRNAAEALGIIGGSPSVAVPALIEGLSDADEWVKRNTSLALARIGAHAQEALPALKAALTDENRYVRANCAHTLHRIGTPAAKDALLDFLLISRWCPSTTRESTF